MASISRVDLSRLANSKHFLGFAKSLASSATIKPLVKKSNERDINTFAIFIRVGILLTLFLYPNLLVYQLLCQSHSNVYQPKKPFVFIIHYCSSSVYLCSGSKRKTAYFSFSATPRNSGEGRLLTVSTAAFLWAKK